MTLTLFRIRSRRGASIWMWDWFRTLMSAFMIAPLGSVLLWAINHRPHWAIIAAALICAPRFTRLHLARAHPGTLLATRIWWLIPYASDRVSLAALHPTYDDLRRPHPDALAAGDWEIACRDAEATHTWLRTAAADLATPTAEVHTRRP